MKKDEAQALLARIRADAPLVSATLDTSKASTTGRGYRLLLHCCQRHFVVSRPGEWSSIYQAWIWFLLPEEQVPVPERAPERERHLVDGIPMTILQRKDGAWTATYTKDGITRKKYFGKVDPRPDYPVWKGKGL